MCIYLTGHLDGRDRTVGQEGFEVMQAGWTTWPIDTTYCAKKLGEPLPGSLLVSVQVIIVLVQCQAASVTGCERNFWLRAGCGDGGQPEA